MEAWGIVDAGLVKEGIIKDVSKQDLMFGTY